MVANLMAAMKGETLPKTYDGYGSCPLTVELGKIVLAEFAYGGKVTPSFPLDPRVPRKEHVAPQDQGPALALLVAHAEGRNHRRWSPRTRMVSHARP